MCMHLTFCAKVYLNILQQKLKVIQLSMRYNCLKLNNAKANNVLNTTLVAAAVSPFGKCDKFSIGNNE